MAKTTNHSNGSSNGTKGHTKYLEDHFNYTSWRMTPVSIVYLEEVARKLVVWVKSAVAGEIKTICIAQFRHTIGVDRQTWNRWLKYSKVLSDANEFAKEVIAARRLEGMIDSSKGWREKPLMFLQHLFDPEFDEANKYHSDLRKQEKAEADAASAFLIASGLRRANDETK